VPACHELFHFYAMSGPISEGTLARYERVALYQRWIPVIKTRRWAAPWPVDPAAHPCLALGWWPFRSQKLGSARPARSRASAGDRARGSHHIGTYSRGVRCHLGRRPRLRCVRCHLRTHKSSFLFLPFFYSLYMMCFRSKSNVIFCLITNRCDQLQSTA
jgi:hypothetical protein